MGNHRWITTAEAAQILGISMSGIYMALLRGRIRYRKPGRDYQVDSNSVIHYMNTRRGAK